MKRPEPANAYTYGNDIYFAPGQYDPNSVEGLARIAHEVTHAWMWNQYEKGVPSWALWWYGSIYLKEYREERQRHGKRRENMFEFFAYEMQDRIRRDLQNMCPAN